MVNINRRLDTDLTQRDVLHRVEHTLHYPSNYCLSFVHTMWGIASDGTGTAHAEADKLETAGLILSGKPQGMAPLFIRTPEDAWHVVLAGFHPEWCWTTDVAGAGTVSRQQISRVLAWCKGSVFGWSQVIDGKRVLR
jgi:hypothetical protein